MTEADIPHRPPKPDYASDFEAVTERDDWQTLARNTASKCRFRTGTTPEGKHVYCQNPAVAALRRGHGGYWAYCAEHMYGRWIEDDEVKCWHPTETATFR